MNDTFPHYDMSAPPVRQNHLLRPLIWVLTIPDVILHGTKITKTGCEGLKPPYLLLCNHNAFYDFKVATKATFPARANSVIAIDGFLHRKKLLQQVGGLECLAKVGCHRDATLHNKRFEDNVLFLSYGHGEREGAASYAYGEALSAIDYFFHHLSLVFELHCYARRRCS